MLRENIIKALLINTLFCLYFSTATGQENPSSLPPPSKLLWEIGTPDNKCLEFALAPTDYAQYEEDAYFMVGHSNPKEDWYYIHPGPKDEWVFSVPHTFTVVFFLKSIDTTGNSLLNLHLLEFNQKFPPVLNAYINGTGFPVRLPPGKGTDALLNVFDGTLSPSKKIEIPFSSSLLRLGENVVQFAISSGSWLIYDSVQLLTPEGIQLAEPQKTVLRIGKPLPLPLVTQLEEKLREVYIPVRCYGQPFQGQISVSDNKSKEISLKTGWNYLYYEVKEVERDTFASIEIKKEDRVISTRDFVIPPAKQMTIYLVPHSHNDIGYTHIQTEVLEIQYKNIARAIDLIEQTKDYPPEAQFYWSAEVLWAIKSFWDKADSKTRERFKKAIVDGKLELPALFTNQLTGLCNGEELVHLLDEAHRLTKETAATIDTALITDVPGYTWGLIPVLAQAGVKYFSIGPNLSWRIGNILEVWGDKPFYWASPCGKHKVLTWIGLAGYSWFMKGSDAIAEETRNYLIQLEKRGFPYDISIIRYSIIGDNGPPDEKLPDFVKNWNEKYKSPKLCISTASKFFKHFEEKYSNDLPTYSGEITPYWEDGSASSARETALNRQTVRELMQLETLWSIWSPDTYPEEEFLSAWENAILYDEHTWGAYNSTTEPDIPFVKEQWQIKQSFALNAEKTKNELWNRFINTFQPDYNSVSQIIVLNPTNEILTQPVVIPADWPRKGDRVLKEGKPVPSQVLKSGNLIFIAKEIPPLGYATYTLEEGHPEEINNPIAVENHTLRNEHIELVIAPETGTIKSIKRQSQEFIKSDSNFRTNEYLYTEGRNPENTKRAENMKVEVKENGPIVGTLLIHSTSAPGAKEVRSEISLYSGLEFVEIVNYIDKTEIRSPEAVHYAFAFDIANPKIRYQTPFAIVHLPEQQLPGSCKNYITAQNWIDLHNEEKGITLFTPDTPMFEIGKITVDPLAVGWKKGLILEPIILSYVMNNYWETNYKASQDGPHVFKYFLLPYMTQKGNNPEIGDKQTVSKLIVLPSNKTPRAPSFLLEVTPNWCLYHLKYNSANKEYIIRLFNPTSESIQVAIKSKLSSKPEVITLTLHSKPKYEPFSGNLSPFETVTLIVK